VKIQQLLILGFLVVGCRAQHSRSDVKGLEDESRRPCVSSACQNLEDLEQKLRMATNQQEARAAWFFKVLDDVEAELKTLNVANNPPVTAWYRKLGETLHDNRESYSAKVELMDEIYQTAIKSQKAFVELMRSFGLSDEDIQQGGTHHLDLDIGYKIEKELLPGFTMMMTFGTFLRDRCGDILNREAEWRQTFPQYLSAKNALIEQIQKAQIQLGDTPLDPAATARMSAQDVLAIASALRSRQGLQNQ
jgi:hypothetical protein